MQWHVGYLRFFILLRMFVTFFVFLELYQCVYDCVNLRNSSPIFSSVGLTFQWRASHLRFLLQPRETKQATTISPLLQILLRIFVTIFVFLELYQCFCDFVNLKINHFREERNDLFPKNIFCCMLQR